MPFFESLADVRGRVDFEYDHGRADLATLPGLPRTVAKVRAVAAGALVGVPVAIAKTFGVAGYEFYSQSFGRHRQHDIGNWLGNAPIAQAATAGALAKGFTAALVYAGISVDWLSKLGLHSTFVAGFGGFMTYTVFRYGAELWWPVILGAAGTQMSMVRHNYDRRHPEHAPKAVAMTAKRQAARRPSRQPLELADTWLEAPVKAKRGSRTHPVLPTVPINATFGGRPVISVSRS